MVEDASRPIQNHRTAALCEAIGAALLIAQSENDTLVMALLQQAYVAAGCERPVPEHFPGP